MIGGISNELARVFNELMVLNARYVEILHGVAYEESRTRDRSEWSQERRFQRAAEIAKPEVEERNHAAGDDIQRLKGQIHASFFWLGDRITALLLDHVERLEEFFKVNRNVLQGQPSGHFFEPERRATEAKRSRLEIDTILDYL